MVFLIGTDSVLECNDNNLFRIVQFTDSHFGESYIGDYLTSSLMNNVLDKEKPDLVVLSGDIISGYTWNGKKNWFDNLWKQVVAPMIERNIPWIFIAGNHDREGELTSIKEIIDYQHKMFSNKGSLSKIGYIDKMSEQNIYQIHIHHNSDKDKKIAKIYMIDSGQLDCNNNWSHMGCLRQSQIEWYLKQNHSIPGIIYMHIPPSQIVQYYQNQKYPKFGQWIDPMNLYCFDEYDIKKKNKSISFIDDYVLRNDDIIAMFHGHEHEIDGLLLYEKDLMIGFGRKTGESWMINTDINFVKKSGARVFEFDCNNPKLWNTWIRDKDLNQIDKISFIEMNEMKNNLSSLEICEDSNTQNNEVKCSIPCNWEQWKQPMTDLFKHPIKRYLVDLMDIATRSGMVQFINDYVYDLGMNDEVICD